MYRIQNMDCPTEESLVRGKLSGMPGIQGLEFYLMNSVLTVKHGPLPLEPLENALAEIGMHAKRIPDERHPPGRTASAESEVAAPNWWPMAISGAAAVAAEVV